MQISDTNEYRRAVRYLPRTLIKYCADNPGKPPIWGEWLDGSLMHCDVTGFTAMSETLGKSGKEGAEIMAGILNQFFERMLGIASEWNGIQMKFGGDAMLLYFKGKQHAECATACGLQMQLAMKEFNQVQVNEDTCQLRMRIGIHSGQFYSLSAGQNDGLLHYLLIGNEVNKAADVEPMAEPDQVVVSDETKALLSDQCKLVKTQHKGIWWVQESGSPESKKSDINYNKIPRGFLRRYLMPPIADGMTTGLLGEHRRVSVVFINLFGLSELLEKKGDQVALEQSNEYLNILFSCLIKYGGHLITSDVCEHGDKILLAFGAPLSLDNQEENAMRFAIELQELLGKSNLELKQSIGVNSGFVFTGEIGSLKRREYTTIGDTVNLAARLMSAADQESILVSTKTLNRTCDLFNIKELDAIRVKGKSQPIDICLLTGIKKHDLVSEGSDNLSSLIGREKELNQLQSLSNQVETGKSKWAFVYGEPGIGKTHLCSEFTHRLKKQAWFTLMGICQSYNLHNAFSVWIYPLRKIFELETKDSTDASWEKIQSFIKSQLPDQIDFAPLIAEILSVPYESNAVVNSLDPKTKRERRLAIIAELITTISKNNPIFMFFDNAQWMDSSSSEVIHNILANKQDVPIYICIVSRLELIPDKLKNLKPDLLLKLKELTNNASRELISSQSSVPPEVASTIIGRAKGNPLFLKALSQSVENNQGDLPESIFDVIMVRIDKMNEKKKSILRNAAIIGQVFDLKTLDFIVLDDKGPIDEKA